MGRGLCLWALAAAVLARTAAAQPTLPAAESDGCEPSVTLSFPVDSAELTLGAQSDLARTATWVRAAPGRSLLVTGPFAAQAPGGDIAYVRVIQAANHLVWIGVNGALIGMGSFEDYLTESEQYALGHSDAVVVLSCVAAPAFE